MKHKHAELIYAWADGAEIQYFDTDEWYDAPFPSWDRSVYRIKPAPKTDIVFERKVEAIAGLDFVSWTNSHSNLKLIFDGETRELKSAEVIK